MQFELVNKTLLFIPYVILGVILSKKKLYKDGKLKKILVGDFIEKDFGM